MSKFKQGRSGPHRHAQAKPQSQVKDRRVKDRPAQPARGSGGSSGQPWLYGFHAVVAAWTNPRRRCHRLLVTSEAEERLPEPVSGRPRPEIVGRPEIERLLPPGSVHQGIALLADPLPVLGIEDICRTLEPETTAVVVVLDRAVDPQNIGAVLRSAAAFGAKAVILPIHHAPDATPAMAKAASGALETVPLVHVSNLARALDQLKKAGFWCIGFDMEAPTKLADADLGGKAALVMGAEGEGLRRLTRETCDLLVRIPLIGAMESLNLSVSTAIALYETSRGR
jgi:23S rRNA (guanosine2251-2'-O)-methyltransferase